MTGSEGRGARRGAGEAPRRAAGAHAAWDGSTTGSLLEAAFAEIVAGLTSAGDGTPDGVDATPARVALGEVSGAAGAEVLAGVVPADLDDVALGEAVRLAERVMSWAASVQAGLITEMHHRAGSRAELVREEVAALLCLSGRAAGILTERAARLTELPALHDALARGDLDTRRVDRALLASDHLPGPAARAVVDEVLPEASGMTAPQLGDAIRRVDAARDPGALEERARAARADRCVRLEAAPDAMAWIHALLPAADAMTVFGAIDALAHHPAEQGDGRTLANRRADALVEVMAHVLDTGAHPDGSPLPTAHGRRPHLSVITTPDLLEPDAVGVGTLVGYGPIPASVVRQVAADADWRAVGTGPLTGEASGASARGYRPSERLAAIITARDPTCTFPGCRRPAVRCDLDHIDPYDPDRPAHTQTCYANLHALRRRHHRVKTHGGWTVARDHRTGRTTWTDPHGRTHTRDPVPLDPYGRHPLDDDPVPRGPRPRRPPTDAQPHPRPADPPARRPGDDGPPPF